MLNSRKKYFLFTVFNISEVENNEMEKIHIKNLHAVKMDQPVIVFF